MNATFNRGRLLRLARTGKLLLVGTGGELTPVNLGGMGEVPGCPSLSEEDFSCRGGSARANPTGTITLTVPRRSGTVRYEFQVAGETRSTGALKADPAPRFIHGQSVKAGKVKGIWLRSWVDGDSVKHLVSQTPKKGAGGKEVVYNDRDLQPA